MAAITVSRKTIEKTVEVEEKLYHLTLSEQEARDLYILCGALTGDGRGRKSMSNIWNQLDNTDVAISCADGAAWKEARIRAFGYNYIDTKLT